MKHWQKYIQKQRAEYLVEKLPIDFSADIVVVIPCYDEPNIHETLDSLNKCLPPTSKAIVVIVINAGEHSPESVVKKNRKTFRELVLFAKNELNNQIFFKPFLFENLPKKHAGVGLARKIGMDLAINYFFRTQNANGIIASLDADCIVSENYLASIFNTFSRNEKLCASVFDFRHRVENNNPEITAAIHQYEKYLHYFSHALQFIGFPYYYVTIGSAFAVSADAYVRVGGMGRQQGGEDFYFLQKVFALEQTVELHDVTVFPIARFSDRIPFGTGPALQKIIAEPNRQFNVYAFEAFEVLKLFFDCIDDFYGSDIQSITQKIGTQHLAVRQFVKIIDFLTNLEDCNANSASLQSFRKRFFHHFNAFRIIKFLNFTANNFFSNTPVDICIDKYQKSVGESF